MRNFIKKDCILNRNHNIGRNNHIWIISPNRSVLILTLTLTMLTLIMVMLIMLKMLTLPILMITLDSGDSPLSRRTSQNPVCRRGRWGAWCTRSSRSSSPAPADERSTWRPAASGSPACSTPTTTQGVSIRACATFHRPSLKGQFRL